MMNRLCKLGLITLCVVIIVEHVVCRSVGVKKQECYGDICNKWSDDQFCSDIFKMCRNCAEVVRDCGTKTQPQECFQFCVSYYAQMEQKREKNSTCSLPRLANGMVNTSNINTNGRVTIYSDVTFSCHTGFTLEGVVSIRCLGNDNWTDVDTPICLNNLYIGWKDYGIPLSVSCSALLILNIILLIILGKRNKQCLKKILMSNCKHDGSEFYKTEPNEELALLDSKSADENKEANTISNKENEVECAKSPIKTSSPPPPQQQQQQQLPSSSSSTTMTTTATSTSASIDKNTEINQCVNGCQAVGNNVNFTLVNVLTGVDEINIDSGLDDKENKNAQNSDGQEPVKSPTKDTTVTEESQETVEAFQETQGTRLSKAAETEENAPLNDNDYARQEPNLVGYNDRAFVATGSRCKTPNCPNG